MTPPLHPESRVCAVIPHYACEEWLGQAIESLVGQTRPPDAIIVVDDASPDPPVDVVAAFPGVSLLAADRNGGPYRLVQAVIAGTGFDAYLFQDADDWSAPDRLEVLLTEAERCGAELVGSHEVRVLVDQGDVVPVRYPLDVNSALTAHPTTFPLLHPTSLVGRALVERVGGFATGMRFSGDADFLRRAAHVARVVNADHFGYFRRKRVGSLTMADDTGLRSPERLAVQAALNERARENDDRAAQGLAPNLEPWRTAPAARLRHVCGPAASEVSTAPPRKRLSRSGAADRPVFVLGGPRCGHAALGWALAQHHAFSVLPDPRWVTRVVADIVDLAEADTVTAPSALLPALATALGAVAAPDGSRWVATGSGLAGVAHALAAAFPQARFLHVVRDVDEVAASLAAAPTDEGNFLAPEEAYRRWYATVDDALCVERALGADRVLRVRYTDLLSKPEVTVARCLTFLDEDFEPACMRPVRALSPVDAPLPTVDDSVADPARSLWRLLEREDPASVPTGGQEDLRRRFRRRRDHPGPAGTLVERVRALTSRVTDQGDIVLVASKGDPRLVDLDGRTGWHLPQVEGGLYAGSHPADSTTAVAQLEELRARGARYLVLPASAFWWLSFYGGLRRHLDRYTLVAFEHDTALAYRLVPAPGVEDAGAVHQLALRAEPVARWVGRVDR